MSQSHSVSYEVGTGMLAAYTFLTAQMRAGRIVKYAVCGQNKPMRAIQTIITTCTLVLLNLPVPVVQ